MSAITLNHTGSATNPQLAQQMRQQLNQLALAALALQRNYGQLLALTDNPSNPTVFTGVESVLGLSSGEGSVLNTILAAGATLLTNSDFTSLTTAIN